MKETLLVQMKNIIDREINIPKSLLKYNITKGN